MNFIDAIPNDNDYCDISSIKPQVTKLITAVFTHLFKPKLADRLMYIL